MLIIEETRFIEICRNRQKTEKNIVLVLLGFFRDQLNNMLKSKLLPITLDTSIEKLAAMQRDIRRTLLLLDDHKTDTPWITMEEYLLMATILHDEYDVVFVHNNLFESTYPMVYPSDDVDALCSRINSEEIEEDLQNTNPLDKLFINLKQVEGSTFVIYNESEARVALEIYDYFDDVAIDELFDEGDPAMESKQKITLELTENEDQLLFLTQIAHEVSEARHVQIIPTISFETNLFHFRTRLEILKSVCHDLVFYIGKREMSEAVVYDSAPYINLLNNNWNYESFNMLRIYKDPDSDVDYKDVVEIPQDRIIHAIVSQAEAALQAKGVEFEAYRDIFVTAPTGSGKSILFQIPALYLAEKHEAITIVISPLIGLMMDQVSGLYEHHIHCAATINSQISPIEKRQIMDRVKNKEIHILYVSPETLLARATITDLIGDRTIGLIVVDEAHIVTTWGKSFRADYWYLGNYLQKLRKDRHFIVATFTATAIYGGPEDMYAETRDSLSLLNPIVFLGDVKRTNITMKLKSSTQTQTEIKEKEYRMNKNKIVIQRLEVALVKKQKTLVYFPTVRLIEDFREYIDCYGQQDLAQDISWFYGTLSKEEKNRQYVRFKSGESTIMLATKAFGMGIDIPNISIVYHFAPTGNVCDYVQEIGRAARDKRQGLAMMDYLDRDFIFVNRLHGLSTLRKTQLVMVVQKILQLYKEGGYKRKMMINADDFRYIFSKSDREDEDIDNKLKTALLVIEKDFMLKLQYSPLIGRPSGLFTNEYFSIYQKSYPRIEKVLKQEPVKILPNGNNYLADNVYSVDLKKLWMTKYQDMSFPQFKYFFYTDKKKLDLEALNDMKPMLRINVKFHQGTNGTPKYKSFITVMNGLFGKLLRQKTFVSIHETFGKVLRENHLVNKYSESSVIDTLVGAIELYRKMIQRNQNQTEPFAVIRHDDGSDKIMIKSASFQTFFKSMIQIIDKLEEHAVNGDVNYFLPKTSFGTQPSKEMETALLALGMAESLGCSVYQVFGGESPQIFIRVASQMQLERMVNDPERYRNQILENVKKRHISAVDTMKKIYTADISTERFWAFTEEYFLGKKTEFS